MAHAWKACWVQALEGSNPSSSATLTCKNTLGGRHKDCLDIEICIRFGHDKARRCSASRRTPNNRTPLSSLKYVLVRDCAGSRRRREVRSPAVPGARLGLPKRGHEEPPGDGHSDNTMCLPAELALHDPPFGAAANWGSVVATRVHRDDLAASCGEGSQGRARRVAGAGDDQDGRFTFMPVPGLGQPGEDLAGLDSGHCGLVGIRAQADRVQRRGPAGAARLQRG